jgi:hypothetical protein
LGLGLGLGLGRSRRLPLPTGQGESVIFGPFFRLPFLRLHFLAGLALGRHGTATRNGIKAAARPGLGAGLRESLLPGLAPVVLVFKDPIELVFHPTTQAIEPGHSGGAGGPAAFTPVAGAGAWAGARHAIYQLAARTHQAI